MLLKKGKKHGPRDYNYMSMFTYLLRNYRMRRVPTYMVFLNTVKIRYIFSILVGKLTYKEKVIIFSPFYALF